MEYRLDELGLVKRGRSKHRPRNAPELYGGKYPFVQTGDVKAAGLHLLSYKQTYNEVGLAQSRLWPKGTLCITIAANIAETSILGIDACFPDSVIGFIADKNKCDTRYIKYLFDYRLKSRSQQLSPGATQDNLSEEKLLSLKFSVPSVPEQETIAEKLGRYDALIENNTRRIAILEAKAQMLYKEWFVRKRGIGNVGGWHKGRLGDICSLKRGKNITSSEMKPGNIPVIAAGLEPSGYHDEANVHGVSITMSSSGANAGFINIHYSDIWAADCAYASEGDTPNIYFAYEVLNNLRPVIDNFKMGAAQPHVYPKHINAIKIEVPPDSLMAEANDRLATIHRMVANLQRQNALLAKERDLLLPRLMSGRLSCAAHGSAPTQEEAMP